MLALRGEGTPFPVQADFRSGNTRVAFDGVVNDPNKSFMGNKSMAAVNVLALVVTLFGQ